MTELIGGKAFFDTNVLLYMYAGEDARKQARAQELFDLHTAGNSLLLSTQVVQEFYFSGSRKLRIAPSDMREAVSRFLDMPLVILNRHHIESAIRIEERYRISFWDALILAAAAAGGAEILYTEDLSDGQRYEGVLVRNPFREGFTPGAEAARK